MLRTTRMCKSNLKTMFGSFKISSKKITISKEEKIADRRKTELSGKMRTVTESLKNLRPNSIMDLIFSL